MNAPKLAVVLVAVFAFVSCRGIQMNDKKTIEDLLQEQGIEIPADGDPLTARTFAPVSDMTPEERAKLATELQVPEGLSQEKQEAYRRFLESLR